MVDVLHVVQIFQRVDQAQHLLCGFQIGERCGDGGNHGDVRFLALEAGGAQRFVDGMEIGEAGGDQRRAIITHLHIIGTRLQCRFHQRIFVHARGKTDLALAVEHVGDRTIGAQVATMLAEGMAHFGGGAVAVVGHGLDDDGHAAGRIALVGQLRHVVGIVGAGTTGDGTVDHIARHVGRQRLVHGQAQARVVRRDRTALGGNGQLTNDLGENLAALGVLAPLAVLDVGPFGMTSHNCLPL